MILCFPTMVTLSDGAARSRAELRDIRVVRVTEGGRDAAFSSLGLKLSQLRPDGFVAIDTEFSGLGADPGLRSDDLRVRYLALRRLAHQSALFSLGISIFNPRAPSPGESPAPAHAYDVATFDLLLCCDHSFQMNTDAGRFLVSHNFDFNAMFARGVPYKRASSLTEDHHMKDSAPNAEREGTPFPWGKLPTGLLWRIGRHNAPVIVHNGLFDLAFMYAAFQGPLPPSLPAFVDALLECVPAGFWDSKVLTTTAEIRASYLGYVFAHSVIDGNVSVRNALPLPAPELTDPPVEEIVRAPETLCALFAFKGFCPRGIRCMFSHDPFRVHEEDRAGKTAADSKEAYKRHRAQSKCFKRLKSQGVADVVKLSKKQKRAVTLSVSLNEVIKEKPVSTDEVNAELDEMRCDGDGDGNGDGNGDVSSTSDKDAFDVGDIHTAGWDAFCTGYCFAALRATLASEKLNKDKNYIALPYKLSNLFLSRSAYAYMDDEAAPNTNASGNKIRCTDGDHADADDGMDEGVPVDEDTPLQDRYTA